MQAPRLTAIVPLLREASMGWIQNEKGQLILQALEGVMVQQTDLVVAMQIRFPQPGPPGQPLQTVQVAIPPNIARGIGQSLLTAADLVEGRLGQA